MTEAPRQSAIAKPSPPEPPPAFSQDPEASTDAGAAGSVVFPKPDSGPPESLWSDFFAKQKPPASAVRREILKLHNAGSHQHVIAALEAALIHGQAQPWMYEVLALSMEIEKFPKDEIERVLLSMTDFGEVNFDTMMYSAAYLVRFGRPATAMRLFRQASSLAPERAEPYELALEQSLKLHQTEEIVWAACGVLLYDWSRDHAAHHQSAEDALKDIERQGPRGVAAEVLEDERAAAARARQRDLVVELTWSGTADLDLEIEEPYGSVCSIAQPQTMSGGFLLNDGYGPKPEDCVETYVCPLAPSGDFRIRIKLTSGKVVGGRAALTITRRAGTAEPQKELRTLVLENGAAAAIIAVEEGRRTEPRVVQAARDWTQLVGRSRRGGRRDANVRRASAEFANSRHGFVTGVVGLQPIIEFIPEGAQLNASAIISPDRRYVRMALSPTFSTITDVFTFSFFGGNGAGGQLPVGN